MGKAIDLLERAYELMDSGDAAALETQFDRLFAPTFELRTPVVNLDGRDAIGWWQGFSRAFPDSRHRIVAAAEEGNFLGIEGALTGTHTGSLQMPDGSTVPATGRSVSLGYAHVAWMDGDRFSKWHVYFDTAAFMAQLGLVPEPATA